MNTRDLSRLAALFSLAALTACGGGGGGDDDAGGNAPPPPADPPPAPAPAPAAGFTLAVAVDRVLVLQGETAQVAVTIERGDGFDGAVQLSVGGLPAGVSASPVVIAAGATTATLTLDAPAGTAHSLPTAATVRGSAAGANVDEALTVTVGGAPGVLDTSFAGGAQTAEIGDAESYAYGMAVQPDGKVITVGYTSTNAGGNDFAVMRHDRDGSLDSSFGTGGKVTTAIAADRGADQARAVAVQPDGKIVVAGYTSGATTFTDFAIVRYNADGTLDESFGTGGKAVHDFFSEVDSIHAIVLQDDGRIIVAGHSYTGPTDGIDFALARYTADGVLDASFGTGGTVVTPITPNGSRDSAYAVTLVGSGDAQRIVAVGGEGDFIAASYRMDGTLDSGFGQGGTVNGVFRSAIGAALAVLPTPDGKLVIAGHIRQDFALARLEANGTPDAAFGSGGTVITPMSDNNWDRATALVRQADGRLIAGGWAYEAGSSNGNFATARYSADGVLDATYGTGGKAVHGLAENGRADEGHAMVLQADERVPTVRAIQGGQANVEGRNRFALFRFWL